MMQPVPTGLLTRRALLGGAAAVSLAVQAAEPPAVGALNSGIVWPAMQPVNSAPLSAADWADMPAIVVFWETWCPYCKRHNERVEQLYQATRGQKIRILGATTERDEAKVRAYVQAGGLHFPVAVVEPGFKAQFSTRKVIPLTCLVSANGQLLQVIPGEMALDDVLSLATQAMGRRPKIGNS